MKLTTIISIPLSFYVSMRYFPLRDALKLPIMVRYNTLIRHLKGEILVTSGGVKNGMLKIGFGDCSSKDPSRRSIFSNEGIILLNGREVIVACESSLNVRKGAMLNFHGNFYNTSGVNIDCYRQIDFGRGVVVSWDTFIMDGDSHHTIDLSSGKRSCNVKPIRIGDRVWIGMGATILKGANIGDGSAVAAHAVVTRCHPANSILAGCPARVIKGNVMFEEDYTEYTFKELMQRKSNKK